MKLICIKTNCDVIILYVVWLVLGAEWSVERRLANATARILGKAKREKTSNPFNFKSDLVKGDVYID